MAKAIKKAKRKKFTDTRWAVIYSYNEKGDLSAGFCSTRYWARGTAAGLRKAGYIKPRVARVRITEI